MAMSLNPVIHCPFPHLVSSPCFATIISTIATPSNTKPYCRSGPTNNVAGRSHRFSPFRYHSAPAIMSTARSTSIEYSRASRASTIAATDTAISTPARKATDRLTPARGSSTTNAATVSVLANAGTSRMLSLDTSIFSMSQRPSGQRMGEELPYRVRSMSSPNDPRALRAALASSDLRPSEGSSWNRATAAATTSTTHATWYSVVSLGHCSPRSLPHMNARRLRRPPPWRNRQRTRRTTPSGKSATGSSAGDARSSARP